MFSFAASNGEAKIISSLLCPLCLFPSFLPFHSFCRQPSSSRPKAGLRLQIVPAKSEKMKCSEKIRFFFACLFFCFGGFIFILQMTTKWRMRGIRIFGKMGNLRNILENQKVNSGCSLRCWFSIIEKQKRWRYFWCFYFGRWCEKISSLPFFAFLEMLAKISAAKLDTRNGTSFL